MPITHIDKIVVQLYVGNLIHHDVDAVWGKHFVEDDLVVDVFIAALLKDAAFLIILTI